MNESLRIICSECEYQFSLQVFQLASFPGYIDFTCRGLDVVSLSLPLLDCVLVICMYMYHVRAPTPVHIVSPVFSVYYTCNRPICHSTEEDCYIAVKMFGFSVMAVVKSQTVMSHYIDFSKALYMCHFLDSQIVYSVIEPIR